MTDALATAADQADQFHEKCFHGVRPVWSVHLAEIVHAQDMTLTVTALPGAKLCRCVGKVVELDVLAVLGVYDPTTGRPYDALTEQLHQPDPTVGGHPARTEGAALYLLTAEAIAGGRVTDMTLRRLAVVSRKLQRTAQTPDRKRKFKKLLEHIYVQGVQSTELEMRHLKRRFPQKAESIRRALGGNATPTTRRFLNLSTEPVLQNLASQQH